MHEPYRKQTYVRVFNTKKGRNYGMFEIALGYCSYCCRQKKLFHTCSFNPPLSFFLLYDYDYMCSST